MAHKLLISNTVEVPVRFTLNDAGKSRVFAFSLYARRKTAEELADDFKTGAGSFAERTVTEYLSDAVTGWKGQTLVVEDDGSDRPADFSLEGLALILGIPGVANQVLQGYLEANGVKGKEKN